jgi:hypothetical protein
VIRHINRKKRPVGHTATGAERLGVQLPQRAAQQGIKKATISRAKRSAATAGWADHDRLFLRLIASCVELLQDHWLSCAPAP